MSCCGTKIRVSKILINSEYKQELPKAQVKQDDIIRVPVEDRKLFRCQFNFSQIIKPQYMTIATIDYKNINTEKQFEQFSKSLQKMVRQQSPIRQNEVRFQLKQKQIIQSRGQIVKSDSDKRQIGEQQIDLKVIDQYKKDKEKGIVKQNEEQKQREMMVI